MVEPTLGLALITHNSVFHIPATLPQFYPYVDDIVVVDQSSTDGTVDISRTLGAKVLSCTQGENIHELKNLAISSLGTDWVYLSDVRERMEPTLLDLFPELISVEGQNRLADKEFLPRSNQGYDCIGFARRSFIDGIFSESYPDYQYNLFRNYCRYNVEGKLINYRNRTELDYTRNKVDLQSRFNILFFSSSEE